MHHSLFRVILATIAIVRFASVVAAQPNNIPHDKQYRAKDQYLLHDHAGNYVASCDGIPPVARTRLRYDPCK